MRAVGLTLISVSLLLLSGCESQQERDANRCASWGYEKGSTEFADCMKEMTIAYEQGRQNEMNAALMYATISSIHSSMNSSGSVVNQTTNYYVNKQKTVTSPVPSTTPTSKTPIVTTKPVVKTYSAPISSSGNVKFNTVKSFSSSKK